MRMLTIQNGTTVRASGLFITLLVAIVAIVPALVNCGVEIWVKPLFQSSTLALETRKVDLEVRKASLECYRVALSESHENERHKSVHFLLAAKLVEDNAAVSSLRPDEIPYWPAASAASSVTAVSTNVTRKIR
jgi:hypothetical protein